MFESHVETCIDWTRLNFQFNIFFSNLPLKKINYCVSDQSFKTPSRRSVLNFKFSVLTFSRSMLVSSLSCSQCSMSIVQKMFLSENISTAIYVHCNIVYKRFAVKNSGISVLSLIFYLSNLRIQSCM